MSVSLPSIAISPVLPPVRRSPRGAEGLAAFGAPPANQDAAPAFGSMLTAATAAPAQPMLAAATTQDGAENPTMLATPDGVVASACPAAPAAMLVPFHWSPAEDTPAPTTPDFATNEGLAVDLEMNASADRSGMPSTNAEPATTDASAPTALDEPVAIATVGADVQPSISTRPPEAPKTFCPTTINRTDFTGQEVPVAPARAQSRQRTVAAPTATRSTVGAAPAVAFPTPAASVTSTGRREIPTTKSAASATATPLTSGWRNPVGPAVASVPVAAATTASDSSVPVIVTPDVVSAVLPVTAVAVPSVPAAAIVAPSQPATPMDEVVAIAPTSAAAVTLSTGSEQSILPGVEVPVLSGEKSSVGRRSTMPVAVQSAPSAPPVATVAVTATPAIVTPAQPVLSEGKAGAVAPSSAADLAQPMVSETPVLPGVEVPVLSDEKPSIEARPAMPVAVQAAPSAPRAVTVAVALTPGNVAPAQPALPVGQPVVVAATDDVTSSQAIAPPVSSRTEMPEFPVALSGVEPDANPPVEPKATVLVTSAAASPIAAISMPTPSPVPAAATVVAEGAPAAGEQPISSGQGMPPTPVVLPVGKTDPVLSSVALPALPATPETTRAVSAIFQPKIYEQQILSEQNVPMPPVGSPSSAQPGSEPLSAPAAVALETPSDVVDIVNFALLTATASAKTGNPLPIDQEFRANPRSQTPVLPQPVIIAVNPVTSVPPMAASSLQPTINEQQVLPASQATLSPIQGPVVDIAPVVSNATIQSGAATDFGRLESSAGQPVRVVTSAAPSSDESLLRSRASSLARLDVSVSSDVLPAPLTNLATPAPVPVPALPVSVAAVPAPVPSPTPSVVNPVPTAATTDTLAPNTMTPPVLSGQEVPVPTAALPVVDVSQSAPATVPVVPVAKSTAGLVPTAVIAPEFSPAKSTDTKPVVAQSSRLVRKGKHRPALEARTIATVAPARASTPSLVSVAVAPTAVANSVIPATASMIDPVVSASPTLSDPNAVTRPVVPPAVMPAAGIAVPAGEGAKAAPQLPSTATAIAGDDLGSALAASLNSISTPVAPEPGSEPTGKTGASDDLRNLRAPASVSRQASTAGISLGLPPDPIGNPANLAPAAAPAPIGPTEVLSPVSAPDISVGIEFPATASGAAFSSQFHAASGSPITALPDDSRDVQPSAEEADPVASGVDFAPKEIIRLRPTAEAMVASHVAASDGISTPPLTRTRAAVATKPITLAENPATPISLNVAAPARVAGSDEATMPTEPMQAFARPAATPSETSGANSAPAASGQVTDVKPEPIPIFSPAAQTRDTATTPLPASNSGEGLSQPASVATGADVSSTAEIAPTGAVAEKFAVPVARDGVDPEGISERITGKNTIKLVGQQEAVPTARAGINAAKKSGTMPSDQPQTSSAAPTAKSPAPAADTAARVEVSTITAPKPELSRTEWVQPAGRTLAIVRDVAERMQTTANRVVEFDVSSQPGTQLSVRLEYRGGVVHTTFRTDSADLRDTLSREWQSAMPSFVAGERSVRLAEPTFTPASAPRGDSQSSDLGGQNPRQPQQDTPQSQEKATFGSEFAFARGATARRTAASAPAADTAAASVLRPDTAQHLHAFA
jgi:hypothetical protein